MYPAYSLRLKLSACATRYLCAAFNPTCRATLSSTRGTRRRVPTRLRFRTQGDPTVRLSFGSRTFYTRSHVHFRTGPRPPAGRSCSPRCRRT
eukprot:9228147-Pyramimonas_sp.AAC.1